MTDPSNEPRASSAENEVLGALVVPPRPEDTVLPGTAERIRAGIPENTRRSYERVWRQFTTWCAAAGVSPLPASGVTLANYVSHLCDCGRAPSTIKHDVGAIAKAHQVAGHPKGVPDTQQANLVLNGYRRELAATGKRPRKAPPATRDRLRMMSAACDSTTLAGRRDRLLVVLGWTLAGRRAELAALRIEDITVGDGELEILIRTSKTDKASEGETVIVPAGEHVLTDPVSLLRTWLAALAEHGQDPHRGPLFRRITRWDTPGPGGGLTPHAISDIIRRTARRAGLPDADGFSGHSLRAGFATTAAVDGIPQAIWAGHGRWNPTSPVPAGYVRAADKRRDNPLRKMGL